MDGGAGTARGDLLWETGHHDNGRVFVARSLSIAREQKAKLLELRAAESLSRMLAADGRRDEARGTTQAVYDWFTEG